MEERHGVEYWDARRGEGAEAMEGGVLGGSASSPALTFGLQKE